MALRIPLPTPLEPPEPAAPVTDEADYDEIIADSFPASDPPPGIIKVGPPAGLPTPFRHP